MFCLNCEKDVSTTISKHVDCNDCRGTGIGYPPLEVKYGICKGRGYLIVEPYYVCDECEEGISEV